MHNLWSWWWSADAVSVVSTALKCIVAVVGVLVFVVGLRETTLRNRASVAEKANAHQRLQAAESELERTKAKTDELALKAEARVITREQFAAFAAVTREFPKGDVVIAALAADQETLQYTGAIREMLAAAKYRIVGNTEHLSSFGGTLSFGVHVGAHSNESAPKHGLPLVNSLNAIGINAVPFVDRRAAPDRIVIYVGQKEVHDCEIR